jgi:hypothetical protein
MKKYKYVTPKVFEGILNKVLDMEVSKLTDALFWNPSRKDELLCQSQLRKICENLIQGLVDNMDETIKKENK